MKTRIDHSKSGKALLLTFHEGFSTYTITLPMPYAIQYFAEGLVSSLDSANQNTETISKLNTKPGTKSEIQEYIRRAIALFDELKSK